MSEQTYQKVYSVNGILQANFIQSGLELAGIPAIIALTKNETYLDVLVPEEFVIQAEQVLYPEQPMGEIYLIPAVETL